jgi:hypothetical protein
VRDGATDKEAHSHGSGHSGVMTYPFGREKKKNKYSLIRPKLVKIVISKQALDQA